MSQFLLTSDYLPTSSDCHEYLSLSNDSWIDIHEWFKGEAERLAVGEIVMPSEFLLSKTVSVLDINNGKLYSYEEIDPILSWYYKLAVKKGQVLLKDMPHEELIKVFDAIFVTMVSWMINYHVMDGIFRNLYLHHPGNIEYTYLSAYCNLALKCISLIISILRRGGVCDEQDFHYLPLPSDIITGNLHLAAHVSAADVICQACQADTQAYNQAQSDSKQHPSPAAELAVREILLCSHILVIFFEFLIFSQTNYLKFDRAFLFCCSSTTYCTIAVTRNAKTWMRGEADPLVRSLMQVSNVEMKCGRMSFNQLALFLKIMFNPGNYERSAFDFQILTSMCDFLGPATMLKLSERINRSANYGPFRDILNKSAAAFPELYRAYGYNDSRRIYHLRKSLITFRNLMNSVNNFIIIFELAFFEHIMLDIVREISLNALALKLYEPYDLLFVFEFLHKKVINRKLEILRHVQHCTVETNFKSEEHTTPFYFPWLYYEELISAEIVDVYFLFTAYMNSMTEIKLPYYFKKPDDLEIHFKRKFPEIVILNDYLSFGLKEYTYQCLHKRSTAEDIAALQSCCKPFESPDIPFKSNEFARLETLANKNRVLANLMCNAKDRFLPVGFEINPSVHYLWPLIKIRDKNQKTVDPKAKDQAKKE
ncbi:N-alpha-acetyltransferase, 35 NatC auxiliary subunit -like protein [Trichinella spiralis]|uniref:N-alpha-acetyltransferase, 35 NatC auxiliary subunit-like protein n=1 Tax=Trichinella spiralis TaxID=6334 RepID=A0A0V1ARJ0_TRISP|nr:N-alpha-acetyltransferase, 35 NatC auxiliary subunit -like protein [Trichinella spiralis]